MMRKYWVEGSMDMGGRSRIRKDGKAVSIIEVVDKLNELQAKSEWINIKDRLPEQRGYYPVLTGAKIKGRDGIERHFPYNAFYENGSWTGGDMAIFQMNDVTHWTEFPEPPKESES